MMYKEYSLIKAFAGFALIALGFTTPCYAQQTKKAERRTTTEKAQPTVQKAKMTIGGMSCSACQSTVKKTIRSLNGVTGVEVSLENRMAFFSYDPLKIKPEQVQKAVNSKGYTAGKPQEVKQ